MTSKGRQGQRKRRRSGARKSAREAGARRDHGNIAALEAVFMGMLLISSVAIVASLQTSPPSITPSRAPLQASVDDLLNVLHLLPTGDAWEDEMERSVGKSILRNYTALERLIQQTMPVGTGCRLWLDNGHTERLLYGPQTRPARESVSASRLYHPDWAYAFMVPTFDTVFENGTLGVQGYTVSQASLVKEGGVMLDLEVATDQGLYARGAVASVRDGPSVSLALRNESGDLDFGYDDPVAPPVTVTQLYHEETNGLPTAGNFEVPAGGIQRTLVINGTMEGSLALVTVTLTDPLGTPHPFLFTDLDNSVVFEIPNPVAGNWSVSASGTLEGTLADPAASTLDISVLDVEYNTEWDVVVTETAGQDLPEGTKLTLRLPSAVQLAEQTSTYQTGWKNVTVTLADDDSVNGTVIAAELDSPLNGASRVFTFTGVREVTSAESMYLIRAHVSGAAEAQATFVMGRMASVTSLDNPVRHGPYLSLPKPMAPGAPATVGVTFSYPATVTGLPETIQSIELRTSDGTPLFANVTSLAADRGNWSVPSPNVLRWDGSVTIDANQVETLLANVTLLDVTTPHERPHRLPVEFATGANIPLTDQIQAYVFEGWFPPHDSDPGFEVPEMTGVPPLGSTDLGVDWFARSNRIAGNMTYNVSSFPSLELLQESLRLGIARSHLNVSAQRVQVGESFHVEVNFVELLDGIDAAVAANALTLDVTDWEVRISLLDPAQPLENPGSWRPTYSARFGGTGANLSITLDPGSLDVTEGGWEPQSTTAASHALGNFTFQPPAGSFFGPHAILAEAKFTVLDLVTGDTTLQTARLLNVVDVVPDSGQSETALYWLSLECWMPDW